MKKILASVILALLVMDFIACSTNGALKMLHQKVDELNVTCPLPLYGTGSLIGAYCDANNVVLVISLAAFNDDRTFNDFVNQQSQYKRVLLQYLSESGIKSLEELLQLIVDLDGQLVYTLDSFDASKRTKIVVRNDELRQIIDQIHTMTENQRLLLFLESNKTLDESTLPVELKPGVKLTGYTLDDANKTLFFEYNLDSMCNQQDELKDVLDKVPTQYFIPNSLSTLYRKNYEIKHRLHVKGREKPLVMDASFVVYSAI